MLPVQVLSWSVRLFHILFSNPVFTLSFMRSFQPHLPYHPAYHPAGTFSLTSPVNKSIIRYIARWQNGILKLLWGRENMIDSSMVFLYNGTITLMN